MSVSTHAFFRNRAAFRKVSLIRRCQPGPRLRKCSMTSRSSRSEMSCLVGVFCRPRVRRYHATISGCASVAGRIFAKSSSVSSRASGSRAMPRLISASSSSVGMRIGPNRLSFRYFISVDLPCIGFAQRNNANCSVARRPHHHVEAEPDLSVRNESSFAVVTARVLKLKRGFPIELLRGRKIDPMIAHVGRALLFVPGISARRGHSASSSNLQQLPQVNCSYNSPPLGVAA
jgi:hypothetical protein